LAAREAGITELVAVLRYEDASNTVLQQLASDHRVRLSTMERARAYAKCLEEGIERSELARVVGVSETSLGEYVRLCDLPDAIQELVDQGIPQKGALELLAIDANLAHSIATAALTHGWSAERIKLEVGKQKAPRPNASPTERKHANKVQAQLRTALRLPVRVSPTQKGGGATITITARRAVDVERLTELLLRSDPDSPSEG
jgi:ParB family chromosome partitioning protein